jgi:hypothetical protein
MGEWLSEFFMYPTELYFGKLVLPQKAIFPYYHRIFTVILLIIEDEHIIFLNTIILVKYLYKQLIRVH